MTQLRSNQTSLLFRQTLGGAILGATIGLWEGIFMTLSAIQVLGLAGRVSVSGAVSAAAGVLLFPILVGPTLVRTAARVSVLGVLFFGLQAILAPEIAPGGGLLGASLGGLLIGTAAGALMWWLRTLRQSA